MKAKSNFLCFSAIGGSRFAPPSMEHVSCKIRFHMSIKSNLWYFMVELGEKQFQAKLYIPNMFHIHIFFVLIIDDYLLLDSKDIDTQPFDSSVHSSGLNKHMNYRQTYLKRFGLREEYFIGPPQCKLTISLDDNEQ